MSGKPKLDLIFIYAQVFAGDRSMSLPQISEFTVRRYANAKSFQRGEAYFEAGAVTTITQRGQQLQAEVEGNERLPYRVSLNFDDKNITSAKCTCAYNLDGWCKHIVATMLVSTRQPEIIEQRPTLEQLLDRLDHVQTQRLVQELVAEQPQLIDVIDQHVSWMNSPVAKPISTQPGREISVNLAAFRGQVKQILREAVRYFEEGYEEDPITEDLFSLVQTALEFSQQGESNNAIAILEAITSTCAENWDEVSEYGADNDEIAWELNLAWCEVILSSELTSAEKVDVQVSLEAWQDEWNADFSMSLDALRQGWDDSHLLRVLQGDIAEMGVWEREVPNYADDLAQIRLKILERQERYQEYLYLAQVEGQTQEYLTMLGRLGRVEEALAAAEMQMSSTEEAFALAKTLAEQGSLPEALDIAQVGFKLPGNCRYELGIWTSDLAEAVGNPEISLLALKEAFQVKPCFVDYQKMAELAGESWENVKTDLLRIIQSCKTWGIESAKVDVFLYEGLIEDAIATVSELSSYHSALIHRVMEAAISHKPDWVITNARRRAEKIMDEGKAEYYSEAVEWLKKVRAAYIQSGRQADWSKYREKLIEIHARKRKLMGMFKERGME
ncbi:SWIM zinc finger family protein [Anabaena sp. FACHB-709]|nr:MULTISPECIES: SWIM zinc finger domain-containing protein [Nostocaceae]HBW30741.1 SWIM zinc finger domain-containing protein [Nostoc sp. UBA8866]MBD2173522.1 SWIM zinc finger domain-containing protein [Anabaena cylindrica FACHB-318]MBD2265169.1 SWIM zinc finger domain-containing protein [Anabaena sp. FACHB-709]MBD2274583.1 SWIM zinc finger domain-containing protein [Nostoc sp. PCC 7120 = FACHB-418]MBD2285514.1 SWIM zinc finger domain-containing protein [Anabaena cylindrica FACHB-170]